MRNEKFIKALRKIAGTSHSCENKKCSCYKENVEEANCWIIEKTDLDKLLEKYTIANECEQVKGGK